MNRAAFRFLLTLLAASACGAAQSPARVVGVVSEVRPDGMTVRTDAARSVVVVLAGDARVQRVAPGEKDLSRAVTIAATDVRPGDRVLARGEATPDGKSLLAAALVVMSAADISKKQEAERNAWRSRGAAGIVVSVDPAARRVVMRIPKLASEERVTVTARLDASIRRYAPDSVRFADAEPSSLEEIQPGDQLRVLGSRAPDKPEIDAEMLVSGSFRTVAVKVKEVNAAGGMVVAEDLDSGKPLEVVATRDTTIRRLPGFAGAMRPPGAGPGPGGGPGGGMPGPMGGGMPDIQNLIERLPPVELSAIAPGETLLVSSTRGAGDSRLTAITVLAGADGLLAMRQAMMQRAAGGGRANGALGGSWNLGDLSMMPMP